MIRVKNVSAYLDESFILRMRVVPRSEQISSSLFGDGDFLCNRKLVLLPQNHESCLIKKKEEYHGRTL